MSSQPLSHNDEPRVGIKKLSQSENIALIERLGAHPSVCVVRLAWRRMIVEDPRDGHDLDRNFASLHLHLQDLENMPDGSILAAIATGYDTGKHIILRHRLITSNNRGEQIPRMVLTKPVYEPLEERLNQPIREHPHWASDPYNPGLTTLESHRSRHNPSKEALASLVHFYTTRPGLGYDPSLCRLIQDTMDIDDNTSLALAWSRAFAGRDKINNPFMEMLVITESKPCGKLPERMTDVVVSFPTKIYPQTEIEWVDDKGNKVVFENKEGDDEWKKKLEKQLPFARVQETIAEAEAEQTTQRYIRPDDLLLIQHEGSFYKDGHLGHDVREFKPGSIKAEETLVGTYGPTSFAARQRVVAFEWFPWQVKVSSPNENGEAYDEAMESLYSELSKLTRTGKPTFGLPADLTLKPDSLETVAPTAAPLTMADLRASGLFENRGFVPRGMRPTTTSKRGRDKYATDRFYSFESDMLTIWPDHLPSLKQLWLVDYSITLKSGHRIPDGVQKFAGAGCDFVEVDLEGDEIWERPESVLANKEDIVQFVQFVRQKWAFSADVSGTSKFWDGTWMGKAPYNIERVRALEIMYGRRIEIPQGKSPQVGILACIPWKMKPTLGSVFSGSTF